MPVSGQDASTGDSKAVVDAVQTPKMPPPEPAANVRTRSLVVLSFWLVVIFLGIPIWWWTTSIHRAALPLQNMLDWAEGRACRPTFPLRIVIDAPSLPRSEAQNLVRTTQHALDDLNEFPAYHLRLTLGDILGEEGTPVHADDDDFGLSDRDSALTVRLIPGEANQALKLELQPHSIILDVLYASNHVPSVSSSSSALASGIANKLQELFLEEQASIAYVLAESPGSNAGSLPSVPSSPANPSSPSTGPRDQRGGPGHVLTPEFTSKLARRATRSFKYSPTYHITISLFTPSAYPSSWAIEEAIQETLLPLLKTFDISNFTIDTQVQQYASFSPSVQQPEHDDANNVWTLRDEDLGAFINAAEWPLTPSIGDGPTINFILYVPDKSITPLVVKSSYASNWLIPQWGGIAILNSLAEKDGDVQSLPKDAIRPALLTFSHQLLSLLGAPDSPSSLPLQLNSLTRFQAASLLLSASSTMGSLARLTVELPSIPIPENVALGVDRILHHLRETCSSLREGRFKEALDHARIAETESERAFFEKSMVGQVYFPDEHKVAVYLPLLGPVGVPLVTSLLKELKRFRKG